MPNIFHEYVPDLTHRSSLSIRVVRSFCKSKENGAQGHWSKGHVAQIRKTEVNFRWCVLAVEAAVNEMNYGEGTFPANPVFGPVGSDVRRRLAGHLHFAKTLDERSHLFGKAQPALIEVSNVAGKVLQVAEVVRGD